MLRSVLKMSSATPNFSSPVRLCQGRPSPSTCDGKNWASQKPETALRFSTSDRGGGSEGKEHVGDEDGGERRCPADEDVNNLEDGDVLHYRVLEALPHEPEDQQDDEEERCEASDIEGDADVLEVVHHFPDELLLVEDDSLDVRHD